MSGILKTLVKMISAIFCLNLIRVLMGNNMENDVITVPEDSAGRTKVAVLCCAAIGLFVSLIIWTIKLVAQMTRYVITVLKRA